jgi:hypothetical protein
MAREGDDAPRHLIVVLALGAGVLAVEATGVCC